MPQYKCPECSKLLSMQQAPPAGKKIVCPACKTAFVPHAVAVAATPVAAKPVAAKPVAAAPVAAAAAPIPLAPPPPPPPPVSTHHKDADDEDSTPYTIQQETEEEKKLAEINKPKFGEVKDKFKKSKRGPAVALLVLPTNLMIAEAGVCVFLGIAMTVIGGWGLVFSDSIPSSEELSDAMFTMFCGGFSILWGIIIAIGAAKMSNLGSYAWAVAGACIAVLPLFAGVFALIALQDPRVKDGFREPESGPVGSEKDEKEQAKADKEAEEDEDD